MEYWRRMSEGVRWDTIGSQSTPENGFLFAGNFSPKFYGSEFCVYSKGMSVPEKFRGYASFSKDEPTRLKLYEYTPKQFDEYDVDIRITHCGVMTC